MIVYMLRKDGTDLYYKRTCGKGYSGSTWVPQSEASIWVHRRGPTSAASWVRTWYPDDEVVMVLEHYQMAEVMHERI